MNLQSKLDKASIFLQGDWFDPDASLAYVLLQLHLKKVILLMDVADFLKSGLCPEENDSYFQGRALVNFLKANKMRSDTKALVAKLKELQKPLNMKAIQEALATFSK